MQNERKTQFNVQIYHFSFIEFSFVSSYVSFQERQDPVTHKWKFTCQHGQEECVGNLIEVMANL